MNILALGLLLLAPEAQKEPRLDLHGDPLPEGSVARLGTVRMRHAHQISGAVFSNDGKSIIASDFYSGVHVWDLADGKELRRFFKEDYSCHCLALSPDGKTLAVALGNLVVHLIDPISGREFGSLPPQDNRLQDVIFSNDSSLIATRTGLKSVHVWDVATQKLLHTITFSVNVGKIAFSSDGKILACATCDSHCRLWDLAQGREVRQLVDDPHGQECLYPLFAPQGGPLAVWGYEDHSIRLFDADGVKEIRRFNPEGKEKTKRTDLIYVRFSPNGKILAIFRDGGRMDLWDVESGKKLRAIEFGRSHKPSFLSFSPDGTKLATAGGDLWDGDHIVRVWDVNQGKEFLPIAGHGAPISSVAISPNGETVATTGAGGIVHLWERSSGKHLFRLEGQSARHVSFSPDGRQLFSWGYEALLMSDSKTGQILKQWKPEGQDAYWTAVSADGKKAFSVDLKRNSAQTYDLSTGKVIGENTSTLYYHHSPMILSPAGNTMVSLDGSLRSVADRKELLHIGTVYDNNPSVAFSADGRKLMASVVAESEFKRFVTEPPAEEIAIVDPVEKKVIRRFGKLDDTYQSIDAAALSPDGRMVVSVKAAREKKEAQLITLWEADTGRERGHFFGHIGRVNSVAFSSDGRFFATGSEDTTALVWDAAKPTHHNSPIRSSAAADLAVHFRDLAGEDAEQAYTSMWALIETPEKTVSFLKDQNGLFEKTDIQKIQRSIRDLDSNKFAERERASKELDLILHDAEPFLKKALTNEPSAEVRHRIELLLQKKHAPTGRELQKLRVLEVLDQIAAKSLDPTRAAVIEILKKLSAGTPEIHSTQEAKASLKRLEK